MFYKMINNGNNYTITHKKPFSAHGSLKEDAISSIFEFAWNMTFSGKGEHRDHRTGGTLKRKNGQIFADCFQGKLAEHAFHNLMVSNGIHSTSPDLRVYGLGEWDSEDIMVLGASISIKSTKSYGNLLLLETKDWDNNAIYLPNRKSYDYTFLVRMNPFCEDILRRNRFLYSDATNRDELSKIIVAEQWEYDVPGFISRDDLITIIRDKHIIDKGSLLNAKTPMDASNYYVQAGCLRNIDEFINEINNSQS